MFQSCGHLEILHGILLLEDDILVCRRVTLHWKDKINCQKGNKIAFLNLD